MITQKIIVRTDSLKLDKIISRYGEDSMRQVVFIVVRPEPDSEELIPITIPEDAVGSFRILKPSGNFVIVPMNKSVLSTGETAFDVVLPASANTAKGSGYYDIRITSDADKYYFTAQGDFLIDDNIISDEVLEDVSEVNGLIFPDDFLTVEDHVAYIDDDTVSTDSTWSSDKINEEIEAHAGGDVSKTVSGNPVTFTDGAAAPLVKCDVTISPKQDLHGYDKPWVCGSGKNKWIDTNDGQLESGSYGSNGNKISDNTKVRTIGTIPVLPNTQYTVSFSSGTLSNICQFSDSAFISRGFSATFTTDANCSRIAVAINSTDTTINCQLELGSTATAYEPYSNICPISGYSSVDVNVAPTTTDTPQTYTVNFGGTYYSGQIDVVRGVLVADKAEFICDGTESGWGKSATTDCDVYMASSPFSDFNFNNAYMTDKFAYSPELNYNRIGYTWRGSSSKQLRIGFAEYNTTTLADFKTWLGNNPLQIVADLATPIEIPLTPTVISSLLGNNTMWTDGDSMEVEYITERFQPLFDSIKQL